MKLARHATGKPNVIVVQGGFHGRTYLTMAMTTSKVGVRAGYQPLPAGIFATTFPRPFAWAVDEQTAVDRALEDLRLLLLTQTAPSETAAFVMEPVLGEGGYLPAPLSFVRGVQRICAENGILFVADEVQTGFARTGRMFAVEHAGVEPDIIVMAKGIASGFPIAAIGARADLMARWQRGAHGGTYGANPMGCAAALATIDVILEEQLVARAAARGKRLTDGLHALQAEHEGVGDVRGPRTHGRGRADTSRRRNRRGARRGGHEALPRRGARRVDVVRRRRQRDPVHAAARGERAGDRPRTRRVRRGLGRDRVIAPGSGAGLDRRALLRLGALTAAAFGGAELLAACGGSSTKTARPRGAASTTTTVADPSVPWWLRGDFAPVTREVEAFDLPVDGTLPRELAGLYVRNGSNPKPGWAPHWFLGDGMVHGVMLEGGKATWYRNRYVHTTLLAAGGGLTASGAPGGASGLSNVSLVHHAGKLLTLGEVGWPYELRATDLTTVGPYDFAGKLAGNMTAHPKIDPATGTMHFFGYNFAEPYLVYHVADHTGALVSSQPVAVKASTMIHDFAITDRDVVFWEMPVLFDAKLALDDDQHAAVDDHAVRLEARVRVASRRDAARRPGLGHPMGRHRPVLRVPRHERLARRRRRRASTCAAWRRCSSRVPRSGHRLGCTAGGSAPAGRR